MRARAGVFLFLVMVCLPFLLLESNPPGRTNGVGRQATPAQEEKFLPQEANVSDYEYAYEGSGNEPPIVEPVESMFYNDNEFWYAWSNNTFGISWWFPTLVAGLKEFSVYINFTESADISNFTLEMLLDSYDYCYFSLLNATSLKYEEVEVFYQGENHSNTLLSGEWTTYTVFNHFEHNATVPTSLRVTIAKELVYHTRGTWVPGIYIDYCWAFGSLSTTTTTTIEQTTTETTYHAPYPVWGHEDVRVQVNQSMSIGYFVPNATESIELMAKPPSELTRYTEQIRFEEVPGNITVEFWFTPTELGKYSIMLRVDNGTNVFWCGEVTFIADTLNIDLFPQPGVDDWYDDWAFGMPMPDCPELDNGEIWTVIAAYGTTLACIVAAIWKRRQRNHRG